MKYDNYNIRYNNGYWQFTELRTNKEGTALPDDYKTYAHLRTLVGVLTEKCVTLPEVSILKHDVLKEWRLSSAKRSAASKETGFGNHKGGDDE